MSGKVHLLPTPLVLFMSQDEVDLTPEEWDHAELTALSRGWITADSPDGDYYYTPRGLTVGRQIRRHLELCEAPAQGDPSASAP